MLIQRLISSNKYEIKCPYVMEPIGICIHNTANDATAANEISYMQSNNNEVSFHIAIDDKESIQGIPFNRNAWAAGDGNGQGNRKYIHIEICYSKTGGPKFIEAEKRTAKEVAALLKQYGWGIDKVKKHQDFSGKYCPHRTLDMGWQRFLNMVQSELNGTSQPTNEMYRVRKSWADGASQKGAYSNLDNAKNECNKHSGYSVYDSKGSSVYTNSPKPHIKEKIDVYYQVLADGVWYQEVKNLTDFAGVIGKSIECIKIRLSKGSVEYRVSPINGEYYSWVIDHKDYAGSTKYNMDRLQVRLLNLSGYSVKYRVHLLNGSWLTWVVNDSDFAGIKGKLIDAIEIEII